MDTTNYGASYFNLNWERCVDGYIAKRGNTELTTKEISGLPPIDDMEKQLRSEDIVIASKSNNYETVEGFSSGVPPLPRKFADLNYGGQYDHAINNYIAWAGQYGLLTHRRDPELISTFSIKSNTVRAFLNMIDIGDTYGVMKFINETRAGTNNIHIAPNSNGGFNITHHPDSPLAGMYIQLVEMMQFGLKHEKCAHCGQWYLPKRKKQPNRNSYCCTSHEKAFNNQKVKQRKERNEK